VILSSSALRAEYTMLGSSGWPYNWPSAGYPEPQGNNYCSVGNNSVNGRDLAEMHLQAMLDAGIQCSGINAEVMPSQWEYQIGPVGPLELGDSIMISRWLLHRLGEDFGITVTFEPKPVRGDWNGAGAHCNFSTKSMRQPGGLETIHKAIETLGKAHAEHIARTFHLKLVFNAPSTSVHSTHTNAGINSTFVQFMGLATSSASRVPTKRLRSTSSAAVLLIAALAFASRARLNERAMASSKTEGRRRTAIRTR
jgi:hypothetical protein